MKQTATELTVTVTDIGKASTLMSVKLNLEGPGGELAQISLKPFSPLPRVRKFAVDTAGRPCRPALLTRDGLLLPPGSTAVDYGNTDGTNAAFRLRGKRRTWSASAACPFRLFGPIEPAELLEYRTQFVYRLNAEQLQPGLRQALEAGAVYRLAADEPMEQRGRAVFLLANERGCFLLRAQAHGFAMLNRNNPFVPEPYDGFAEAEEPEEHWGIDEDEIW